MATQTLTVTQRAELARQLGAIETLIRNGEILATSSMLAMLTGARLALNAADGVELAQDGGRS